MNQEYRRKNTPEFEYFMRRVLGAVSPKQNDFKIKKHKSTISEIFSATDEAFALLFLFNDYESWNNSGNGKKTQKRFTDSRVGSKEGWSLEGRMLFIKLVKEITKRRAEESSRTIETALMAHYRESVGEDREERERKRRKLQEEEMKFDVTEVWDASIFKDAEELLGQPV